MVATPITTNVGTLFYDAPAVPVSTSSVLPAGAWTAQPYLYVKQLRRAVAPDIDRAVLEFRYGPIMRPDSEQFAQFDPRQLNGLFVRLEFPEWLWYGQIEIDETAVDGSRQDEPQGKQQVTAHGLLRLLERTTIKSAVIEGNPDQLRINRGLVFNDDASGEYSESGNRAANADRNGDYRFSSQPRGEATWNAYSAARHLVKYHPPLDAAGDPLLSIEIVGDAAIAEWYKIRCRTDRRNVKKCLDDLIDRRRGVGYFANYVEFGNRLELRLFSFLDAPLTLPSGEVIPANANQRTLEFEQAVDVRSALIRNTWSSKFDTVVVEGARKTSTFTVIFDDTASPLQMVRDWTDDDLDDYKDAASVVTQYALLDRAEKFKRNEAWRSEDRLRHVFTRYLFDDEWDQQTGIPPRIGPYPIAPNLDDDGNPINTIPAEPLCTPRLKVRDKLPLKDRYEYHEDRIADGTTADNFYGEGDPEFVPIFAIVDTATGSDEFWERLDTLGRAGNQEEEKRTWSANLKALKRNAGVEIKVRGGPAHLLASDDDMDGAAATDPKHEASKRGGLDWRQLQATLCVYLDSYVTATAVVQQLDPGQPERRLVMSAPEMRLDYVVPYTVVSVHDGELQRTSDGGFVRDDRDKLEDIARAAAEWYGRTRQALTMSYRQLTQLVNLGELITDVGPDYNLAGVNSPITAIVYNVAGVLCEFETSFADFDFR